MNKAIALIVSFLLFSYSSFSQNADQIITESSEPLDTQFVIVFKYIDHYIHSESFVKPLLDNRFLEWFSIKDSLGRPKIVNAKAGFMGVGDMGKYREILFPGKFLIGSSSPIEVGFNGKWNTESLENKVKASLLLSRNDTNSMQIKEQLINERTKFLWPCISKNDNTVDMIYFNPNAVIAWEGDLNQDGRTEYILLDNEEKSCFKKRIFLISGFPDSINSSSYLLAKIDVNPEDCQGTVACRKFYFEMYAKAFYAEHKYKDLSGAIEFLLKSKEYLEDQNCIELNEYQESIIRIKELKAKLKK